MPLDDVVFWVFAPISIASAIGMLLVRNAIHAALFLVVNFFCLAVFFLLLVAAIAAMVLAHRKARAVTQAEIDAVADEDVPVYDDAGAAS